MKSTIERKVSVQRTPRLIQFAGMYGMDSGAGDTLETKKVWEVDVTLPADASVIVIKGPSMGGKNVIADILFPGKLLGEGGRFDFKWPTDQFIGDGFPPELSNKEISQLLSSVGFSSKPHWLKIFSALSTGGKWRVNLARAFAEAIVQSRKDGKPAVLAVDEFGGFLHPTARKIAAAAIAKTARRFGVLFIPLCSQDDCVPYFNPDGIIDVTKPVVRCESVRRLVRRPPITLRIERTTPEAWDVFSEHHYLDHGISPKGPKCFVGYIDDLPVVFTAVIPHPHATKPGWREHRTVCLPDFQGGIGIGSVMSEFVASLFVATGLPYYSTTSSIEFYEHRRKRKHLWRMTREPSIVLSHSNSGNVRMGATSSVSRLTAGFAYVGPARLIEARGFGFVGPRVN